MSANRATIWVFDSHSEAEASIKELQRRHFDMTKLSILGKDQHTEENVVGFYDAGDRMKVWGRSGAFWGGLSGMLFGSAMFVVPGVGPLLVFGPMVGWIVGALEVAVVVGGLSAIGAALHGLGIQKDSILQYETAIKADKFVLLVRGSAAEVAKAREIVGLQNAPCTTHELEDRSIASELVPAGAAKAGR